MKSRIRATLGWAAAFAMTGAHALHAQAVDPSPAPAPAVPASHGAQAESSTPTAASSTASSPVASSAVSAAATPGTPASGYASGGTGSDAAPAKPAGRISIAVMPFAGKGVDSNSTGIIVEALADELLRTGKFRVMERSQMDKILKEQGLQNSGLCEGGECAVEMGRLLGIDQMIVGSVGLLGSTYVVNARLVDVATGELMRSSRRSVSGEIDKVFDGLTRQVAIDLSGEPGSSPAPIATPAVAPPMVMPPSPPPAPVPAAPAPAVSEKKGGSGWLWWTAGGLAVVGGGGAAAYFLLLDDGGSGDGGGSSGEMGQIDLTWTGE